MTRRGTLHTTGSNCWFPDFTPGKVGKTQEPRLWVPARLWMGWVLFSSSWLILRELNQTLDLNQVSEDQVMLIEATRPQAPPLSTCFWAQALESRKAMAMLSLSLKVIHALRHCRRLRWDKQARAT